MMKVKKVVKWSVVVGFSYFLITTLYFGYDDIDAQKGIYKFYWSGLRALWGDEPFGFGMNKVVETKLKGIDGPYIYGDTCYYVDFDDTFYQAKLDTSRKVTVSTSSKLLQNFSVTLKDSIAIENALYKLSGKLIAISDIEGNFDSFYSFLVSNKVIDQNASWVFGNGHLVLNGDFFDRGNQVTQVLWLIYHIENQAEQHGGKVHYILGNHEVMNLYGDVSYNDFKYIEVAKRVSKQNDWDKALRYLYSEKSELGRWLRSKNIVEEIGDNIFVHGGLNTHHLNGRYSIKELNDISRQYYGLEPTGQILKSERDRPVISSINSPFWDRRLNFDWKYKIMFSLNGVSATATTQSEVDSILAFYSASKIVIGHSVVDDISAAYDNKVIKIDVKHGQSAKSGKTKGLLIENNTYYKVDDLGTRAELF